jgi:hypothetical protein
MVAGGSQGNRIDRDLWTKDASNLTHGNHVATVVTYEMTGRSNVQRFPGLFTATTLGAGLGDLNFNGVYAPDDVNAFSTVFNSNNAQFNAAADLDADGRVQESDLLLLGPRYTAVAASSATKQTYNNLLINVPAAAQRTVTALLDNSGGSTLTKTSGGTLNISGPQAHGAGASMTVSGGVVNFNSDAGSSAAANLRLTVMGSGSAQFNSTQHLARLTVDGARATVTAPLVDTKDLEIRSGGNLDLGTADMIVRGSNGDGELKLGVVSEMIRSARAGGTWEGPGLGSSAARDDLAHLTTLGVMLNELDGQPIYNTFAGESVGVDSVLVRYTLTGDLDLDRDIDEVDYGLIDAGFAAHQTGYHHGDIDFSGAIDADDYFLIDRAFANQGAALAVLEAMLASSAAASVPEPASLAMGAAMAALLVGRRRRS